ncbi:MAG: BACON domain-containing protein [Candidatus Cryptobacteroides sp.]
MRKFMKMFVPVLVALWSAGCTDDCGNERKEKAALEVDVSSLSASSEGETLSIRISSNCYWDVSATDADGKSLTWIAFSPERGQEDGDVIVTVSPNTVTEERDAYIHVTTPADETLGKTIYMVQEAGKVVKPEGYSFPVCEIFEIDSPDSRMLVNAVLADGKCTFKKGMTIERSNAANGCSFVCPSHTQPSAGTDADKSIHQSVRFDGFEEGESVTVNIPVNERLAGALRLMFGARAASFTSAGKWKFEWSNGDGWNAIDIPCAETPGSDAVWNIVYFEIPEGKAVEAGGTLSVRMTALVAPSKGYINISTGFVLCNAHAPASGIVPADDNTVAFSCGFDDLTDSRASYIEIPAGFMRSATNSYASNQTTPNGQYTVPEELKPYAAAYACYERPGYLQVGYYDESLWTRVATGTYTIKIGECLKRMGVSLADAEVELKAAVMTDCRGYSSVARITLSDGASSTVLENPQDGVFKDYKAAFAGLNQNSVITISAPALTAEELAALGRGENAKYLTDYRFFIDDIVVKLTEVHARGTETDGNNEDFTDGGNYGW